MAQHTIQSYIEPSSSNRDNNLEIIELQNRKEFMMEKLAVLVQDNEFLKNETNKAESNLEKLIADRNFLIQLIMYQTRQSKKTTEVTSTERHSLGTDTPEYSQLQKIKLQSSNGKDLFIAKHKRNSKAHTPSQSECDDFIERRGRKPKKLCISIPLAALSTPPQNAPPLNTLNKLLTPSPKFKPILPKPSLGTLDTPIKIQLPNKLPNTIVYNAKHTKIQPRVNISTPLKTALQTPISSPRTPDTQQLNYFAKVITPTTSNTNPKLKILSRDTFKYMDNTSNQTQQSPQPIQILLPGSANQAILVDTSNFVSSDPTQQYIQLPMLNSQAQFSQGSTTALLLIDSNSSVMGSNGVQQIIPIQNSLQASNNTAIMLQCSEQLVNTNVSTNGQSNIIAPVTTNSVPSTQIVRLANNAVIQTPN